MKAIRKFPVPVLDVRDHVTVVCVGALLEMFFGSEWWKVDHAVQTKAVQKFCRHHGAHFYAEDRWVEDENGNETRGFSVWKGVYQAKRFGSRMVVVEDLS